MLKRFFPAMRYLFSNDRTIVEVKEKTVEKIVNKRQIIYMEKEKEPVRQAGSNLHDSKELDESWV